MQEKEKENSDEEPEEPEESKKMKKPASKKAKSQATSKLLKRPAAALGKKKAAAPTDGENQTEEQVDTEPTAKKQKNKEKSGKSKNLKEDQKPGKKDKWAEKAKSIQISQDKQPDENQTELRDEKKAYFFRKQMGKLPADVKALFDSNTVTRADKTALVNGLVVRDSSGKLSLNLEAPVVSLLQSHYTDVSGSHKAKGYPRSLMVAKLGGDLAFAQALEKGEIRETEQDGSTFYFFNTITIEKKVGAKAMTTGQVAKAADDQQIGALSAFVESFQPTFRTSKIFLHFSHFWHVKVNFGFPFSSDQDASSNSIYKSISCNMFFSFVFTSGEIPGMASSSNATNPPLGSSGYAAAQPSAAMQLAIADQPSSEIQLEFSGVASLDGAVVAKIDEGLGWWKSLREQARKVLEKPSKPAQEALRKEMANKMAAVWNLQVTLEQFKTFGAKDVAKLRSTMSEFASGLISVQEMVKGLQAMN